MISINLVWFWESSYEITWKYNKIRKALFECSPSSWNGSGEGAHFGPVEALCVCVLVRIVGLEIIYVNTVMLINFRVEEKCRVPSVSNTSSFDRNYSLNINHKHICLLEKSLRACWLKWNEQKGWQWHLCTESKSFKKLCSRSSVGPGLPCN